MHIGTLGQVLNQREAVLQSRDEELVALMESRAQGLEKLSKEQVRMGSNLNLCSNAA